MSIDLKKTPFLFSVGTWFAYKIDCLYYNKVHFVWCTPRFNDKNQPITSRPHTICKRYLEQVFTGDRHTKEISKNKAGILGGAQKKLRAKEISKSEFNQISSLVSQAVYEDFAPVLYIIDARKIGADRCQEVPEEKRASSLSEEYTIADLSEGEFELVDFRNVLADCVNFPDKKAGM